MATHPSFPAGPRTTVSQLSVGNTALDGSGTKVDIFTASGNASFVKRIRIKATDVTTAGKIIIFVKISSTYYPILEVDVTAVGTVDATHKSFEATEDFDGKGLELGPSVVIAAAPYNSEPFNISVEAVDF